jgi:micrococcal nuclease
MYEYRATVLRVLDGDTVELLVDLGFKVHTRQVVRLEGVDAPKLEQIGGNPAGHAAKRWLEDRVLGMPVHVRTIKDRTEKYGRYLVWLWWPLPAAGTFADQSASLNLAMVDAGHARPSLGW